MSLLTKDLIEKCKKYPLRSQDGKGGDATVIARFYIPPQFCRDGAINWIITESDIVYENGKPVDGFYIDDKVVSSVLEFAKKYGYKTSEYNIDKTADEPDICEMGN